MATVVSPDRLFNNSNSARGWSKKAKEGFPWNVWLDGQCRAFHWGEDFDDVMINNFITTCRKAAEREGLKLEVHVETPMTVVWRAYKPGE